MAARWWPGRLCWCAAAFATLVMLGIPSQATEAETETPVGEPKIECLNQHEQAQVSRHEGRLLEARAKLLLCSLASCPPAIRADCVDWIEQVSRSLPSVVVTARARGQDITNVKVFVDDNPMAERLTGAALDLDPGEHRFRFESQPWPAVSRTILVSEGVKGRVIDIELAPAPPETTSQALAQPAQPPPPVLDHPPHAFDYALGGLALASLGTFAVAGSWALVERHDLRQSCAPFCSDDQVSSVSTKLVIADVALGATAASLAVLYFRLSRSGVGRQTSAPQASSLAPVAQATRQGAAVGVGGRF